MSHHPVVLTGDVARQDSHAVPVTVTVVRPADHPAHHAPPGTLAFSGGPIALLLLLGLVLTAAGTATVTAARRRTAPALPRSCA